MIHVLCIWLMMARPSNLVLHYNMLFINILTINVFTVRVSQTLRRKACIWHRNTDSSALMIFKEISSGLTALLYFHTDNGILIIVSSYRLGHLANAKLCKCKSHGFVGGIWLILSCFSALRNKKVLFS